MNSYLNLVWIFSLLHLYNILFSIRTFSLLSLFTICLFSFDTTHEFLKEKSYAPDLNINKFKVNKIWLLLKYYVRIVYLS